MKLKLRIASGLCRAEHPGFEDSHHQLFILPRTVPVPSLILSISTLNKVEKGKRAYNLKKKCKKKVTVEKRPFIQRKKSECGHKEKQTYHDGVEVYFVWFN